jgi:hypothetical protein
MKYSTQEKELHDYLLNVSPGHLRIPVNISIHNNTIVLVLPNALYYLYYSGARNESALDTFHREFRRALKKYGYQILWSNAFSYGASGFMMTCVVVTTEVKHECQ